MLAAIRRGLARFWYGPTQAPGAVTFVPRHGEHDEEDDSPSRALLLYLREEEDEEDTRHDDER